MHHPFPYGRGSDTSRSGKQAQAQVTLWLVLKFSEIMWIDRLVENRGGGK